MDQEQQKALDEEALLDQELANSIKSVQAGNALQPEKVEVKPEGPGENPEPEVEDPSVPPLEKKEEYDFRVPNKGKFESDESFEKRIELLDLVKRRKLAKTPELEKEISDQIKTVKGQIKNLNGADKIINPLNNKFGVDTKEPEKEEDEEIKADRERLKELGGATKEDIQEILRQERFTTDVSNTLKTFTERHDVFKDEDVREVFFDFVESNYNWQEKSGKELLTVLELAREAMFKQPETIQDRVLKGADVQNKVNAMQFPGGTIAKGGMSQEMRSQVDEMMKTGMSEEKAIELLSD